MLADSIVPVGLIVLEEDFCLREDAYLSFPPEINNSITREAIRHFQVNTKNAVKHIDHVCCCCNRFVDLLELESISDNNAVLMTIFETYILHYCNFDVCGCCSGSFNFCYDCWTCVSISRKPKFGIFNNIPKLCCQYYLILLEDLTFAEEDVIARAHLVITILKLRPNNSFNSGTYRGICRYFVLLLQNPRQLLTLLPLKTTSVDDVMRVV